MIVSLSGNYSPLLTTSRNGAMLAAEEINSRDGKLKLNLVIEDDESDNIIISDKTQKLLNEKIKFIIYSVTSGAYSNVEDLINKNDVLAVSTTVASDAFVNKDDNLIRLTPNSSGYAEGIASYVLSENKKRTVIVYDSNNLSYAGTIIEPFIRIINAGSSNNEIFEMDYNTLESPSFQELGRRIKEFEPDSVLVIASPFDTALICQHIFGEDYLKLITSWGFSDELIENGGRAVEGVIVYIQEENTNDGEVYQEFASSYADRFGSDPTFQSLATYEAINFLYDMLAAQQNYDPAKIKQAMIDSGGFQGIKIMYELNRYGDCLVQLQPYTIKDGKFVRLQASGQ